jgi:ComF family protein
MFKTNVCGHCGRPLRNNSHRCGECLLYPPPFRKHISYGGYEEELKELILKFKYGNVEKLKHLLAGYYIEIFYKKIDEPFDFIIPVPPDKGRKREFDPVLEIAKILSKQLGMKLLIHHLVKIKKTQPQAGLTRSQRLNNLNGAFKLTNTTPSLNGKKILLIDDVYTTGTTVKKCTDLLTKEDADVVALTLARSI